MPNRTTALPASSSPELPEVEEGAENERDEADFLLDEMVEDIPCTD